MRKVSDTYILWTWTPKKGTEEEGTGGEGGGRNHPAVGLRPLYRGGPAVASTGGRT
jgi:hypothetical protein